MLELDLVTRVELEKLENLLRILMVLGVFHSEHKPKDNID